MAIRINIDAEDKRLKNATAELSFDYLNTKVKNEIMRALETGICVGGGEASHIAKLLHDHKSLPYFSVFGTRNNSRNGLWISKYHMANIKFKQPLNTWLLTAINVMRPEAQATKAYNYQDSISISTKVAPKGVDKTIRTGVWDITDYDPKADETRVRLIEVVKQEMGIQR